MISIIKICLPTAVCARLTSIWIKPRYHSRTAPARKHAWTRYLLEKNGLKVLVQRKTNADVRVLFQLANAYLLKVLWTKSQALNLLICATLMAPFNVLGALLCKVAPANPDLYLDQVVLARRIAND